MKTVERYSTLVILIVGLMIGGAFGGRLGTLLLVNRMAIRQMQGKTQLPIDLSQSPRWYLLDYVAGRGRSLEGSFGAAIPLLESANTRWPDFEPSLLQLGLAHLHAGSQEEGLKYLRRVRGIRGRAHFNYLVHLGWEEVLSNRMLPPEKQDWRLAERFYRAAVALSPDDLRANRALIELYLYWSKDGAAASRAVQDAASNLGDPGIRERFAGRIASLQAMEQDRSVSGGPAVFPASSPGDGLSSGLKDVSTPPRDTPP